MSKNHCKWPNALKDVKKEFHRVVARVFFQAAHRIAFDYTQEVNQVKAVAFQPFLPLCVALEVPHKN